MTLVEKLNRYGVQDSVEKGVVTLEAVPDDFDDLSNEEGDVIDQGFSAFLGELETFQAYLDLHPYGREGGYVPHVETPTGERAYYNESEGEWVTTG